MRIAMRMVYLLLAVLAAVVVLMLASRLWPASAMQKQARAALEQPLDWPGANAWAQLQALEHEGLDEAQRQRLVDDWGRRFAHWAADEGGSSARDMPAAGLPPGTATLIPQSPALGGEAVKWEDSAVLCDSAEAAECLGKVRQAPAAVAAELASRQALLQRVSLLAEYGHLRTPYASNKVMLRLRTLPRLFDPLAAHALAHVQGNSGLAMEGMCRDMRIGRMLLSNSDSMNTARAGQELLQANGQLLAQVLAELPAGQAMPAQCKQALAPLSANETGLCRAMRTDFAMATALMGSTYEHESGTKPGISWLFNLDKTKFRMAALMGEGCLAPLQQQLAHDQPVMLDERKSSLWRMECPANAIGCLLTTEDTPAYAGHFHELQDVAAQQRLLATVAWLRQQPVQSSADVVRYLQQLPAELVSLPRPISLSDDGRALQTGPRYDVTRPPGWPISVPLPSGWWPDSTVAPAL